MSASRMNSNNQIVRIRDKDVFTTGDAALLCGCSQQYIIKRFDKGDIKGYKVPGSRFRRIPREQLYEYMSRHNLPGAKLINPGPDRVMIITADGFLAGSLQDALSSPAYRPILETIVVASSFAAGLEYSSLLPRIVIVDFSIGPVEAWRTCSFLSAAEHRPHVVALVPDENNLPASEKITAISISKPNAVDDLAHKVRQLARQKSPA